ncbi:hypothetical protein BDA99DRAFT_515289 [Phascolomyces articulosus]|uniref:ER-bound oxygenase mpaB/mpaB'/Rubber oxygenase catalytic domain-containing protein n=1 Tax=Phascolomyces articulosus TaxID=60185 RepID=A0AAD5JWQ5_9FUNG|nr:hypothetical protein BDA99DRAFT_515289 [Phascolomyces articulosus]
MTSIATTTLIETGKSWLDFIFKQNGKETATIGAATAILYLALVRLLRYRNINAIKKKYPDPTLALTDPDVAAEVYDTTVRKDFPFIGHTSLEFALFKTYSVPTISKILYGTTEFSKSTRRRAEDTELILLEIADVYPHIEELKKKNPNPSAEEIKEQQERSKIALNRMNELHSKYPIKNGDFLYTLSLFIVEPIKWINKYEWRQLEPIEKNAIFRIWYDIGVGMNIKDIPTTLEGMYEFHEQYAKDNVRFAPSNWKVAHPTVEHLLSRFPKFVGPLAYKLIPALLDPMDVEGFGIDKPTQWAKQLVNLSFFIRSTLTRHLFLPRFQSKVRTPIKPDPKTNLYIPLYNLYEPTYPNGYCIYELGPEKRKPTKCPVLH